jgi:hypothetical protein
LVELSVKLFSNFHQPISEPAAARAETCPEGDLPGFVGETVVALAVEAPP